MKRRATGLLVVMAVAFVVITVFGDDTGWTGYVQAAVAASLVGGVADWFAVTAVFRHPLGVPIPHTAVIVERKDKFGETLGAFVQENFLSPDTMSARLREAHIAERLGAWLAVRSHAEVVAQHVADVAVELADTLREEDVQDALHEQVRRGLENVPLAPMAGKALLTATEDGRHQQLLDVVLRGAGRFLDENRETLRARFEAETPWWVPTAIDRRIFDRLLDGLCSFFEAINTDEGHELRSRLDDWINGIRRPAGALTGVPGARGTAEARAARSSGAAAVARLALDRRQGGVAVPGRRPRIGAAGATDRRDRRRRAAAEQ